MGLYTYTNFESQILIPKLLFLNSYSYILCTQTLGTRKPSVEMLKRGKIVELAAKIEVADELAVKPRRYGELIAKSEGG